MKRRDFLKSTLLLAAVSTVLGKASGLFNQALAAGSSVAVGKLGYKLVSPQAKNGKQCSTCKHYKANKEAGKAAGECVLPAMKSAMKPAVAPFIVLDAAYCNMWAKKIV
jgi:hypothetical protein